MNISINTNFVRGKGHCKSGLQKAVETINEWLERLKRYNLDIHICGDRNSYSKTDPDATFMHMKEDHMKNGQLKPRYNVNVATVSEYIVGNYISADRTDTKTFIPFLKKLCSTYPVQRVVVDSGYPRSACRSGRGFAACPAAACPAPRWPRVFPL